MYHKEISANGKLIWNNYSIIILIVLLLFQRNPEE